MLKILATASLFFIALTLNATAMKKDPIERLSQDAISYLVKNFLEPKVVFKLCEVNTHWYKSMSDENLWSFFYAMVWKNLDDGESQLSWKEKFKKQSKIIRKLYIFSWEGYNLSEDELNKKFQSFFSYAKLTCDLIANEHASLREDLFKNYLASMISTRDGEKLNLIADHYGPHFGINFFENYKVQLEESLSQDIVMLFCAGATGLYLSDQWEDQSVHDRFPNLIWVGFHDENGRVCSRSNRGNLVEIFAPCTYPSMPYLGSAQAIMWVVEVTTLLRVLRPDLRAQEIRLLLIDSADIIDGFNILNIENALFMAKAY